MVEVELQRFFQERVAEIDEYLKLLNDVELASRSGPPKIGGADGASVTTAQQKILYSSLYLQLYNLVEATVSRCLDAVGDAIAGSEWRPLDLTEELRKEWVRSSARTHTILTPDNRLKHSVAMVENLLDMLPVAKFSMDVGGGGSWDEDSIQKASERIGCLISIRPQTRTAIKRKLRDDMGALKLVKHRRNGLAHGSLSFVECSEGVSTSELGYLSSAVTGYLREAIECFTRYIEQFEFLRDSSRPRGVEQA